MHNVISGSEHDELARSAIERSRLYDLLATVFRHEPSPEFLSHLKAPEMADALSNAGIDLGEELEAEKFADLAEALAIEYTRLFFGPGKHISPHESVQLKRGSGILWGAETSAVHSIYHAAGFELGESETNIPDHLSVELNFLSLLASQESQAWADQDLDCAAESLHLQHDFISQHLGKWAAAFCAKVTEEAEFAFYPAFADLLRGYLSGEKADIVDRLSSPGAGEQSEGSVLSDGYTEIANVHR
ncbi:MAG: molecular chaperone TorD family protein [Rhodospirillales bacterium]